MVTESGLQYFGNVYTMTASLAGVVSSLKKISEAPNTGPHVELVLNYLFTKIPSKIYVIDQSQLCPPPKAKKSHLIVKQKNELLFTFIWNTNFR